MAECGVGKCSAFLTPSIRPLDPHLIAIVSGRADVDIGNVPTLEHQLRIMRNFAGRRDLTGPVDDPVVSSITAKNVVGRRFQDGWCVVAFDGSFTWTAMQKDRTGLGIRLQVEKWAVGEDYIVFAVGHVLQAGADMEHRRLTMFSLPAIAHRRQFPRFAGT